MASNSFASDTHLYVRKRDAMVTSQIVARGVKDEEVLRAMRSVPRHLFVPPSQVAFAYNDYPLAIGKDQTISQPYIVALMTELLDLGGDEKVLEIGTGSGYQAAVLAEIVKEVYSMEIIPELAERAEKTLTELGYDTINVRCGDGYLGWPEKAPFDAIIITAAAPHIPQPLVDQLRIGGRMVLPVNTGSGYQILKVLTKTVTGSIEEKDIIPVRFVPLVRNK
jgi:protein-L-isoaspartate(D-aspartate) O-methyltransferase